jgi:hypothetical protein
MREMLELFSQRPFSLSKGAFLLYYFRIYPLIKRQLKKEALESEADTIKF